MTNGARTSETSVNFYQTTWRSIPEDSHLKSVLKLFGPKRDEVWSNLGNTSSAFTG
jgi:hypothetical protein